jgi:Cell division protein
MSKPINTTTFINSRITATISTALVLFLLGLVVLLALFAKDLSVYVKENLSFSIILNDDLSDPEIKDIRKKLSLAPYVKSAEWISKEQAAKELESELGENPETFLGYNPLYASIEVKLKAEYANEDSIRSIEKELKAQSTIQDILYRKDLMQSVNENIKKIGLVLFILTVILLCISIALINNTIRLMIYSKRFIIYTMKLVGATNKFIRRPFIRSNVLSGIIAAVLAVGALLGLLYYAAKEIPGFIELTNINTLLIVGIAVAGMGIIISVTATYFGVNRYLHMKSGDLYYV